MLAALTLDDVRVWLHRELASLAPSSPIRAWSPVEGGFGTSVRIQLSEGSLRLSARPKDEHPGWLELGTVTLNVDGHADPIPPTLHAFLRSLGDALRAAEAPTPTGPAPRAPAHRAGMEQRLHRAAFYAHQILRHDPRILPVIERHDGSAVHEGHTLVLQEYYPYVGALGTPTPEADIRAGWERTAARLREGIGPPNLGVYVHVPFCTARCHFCFCSMTDRVERDVVSAYLERVIADLEAYGRLVDGVPVSSVFVGGGTPSLLPKRELERLFGALRERFTIPPETQVTMESNPDSLTVEKVALLARAGVTRLTLGIQSIDPETQRRANRFNKPEKIRALAEAIRAHGIILHIDVMAGMDGQSVEAFQRDVHFALGLAPDSFHLSPFRPVGRDGRADPAQVARRREMVRWGEALLEAEGLFNHLGFPRSRREGAVNAQLIEWRDRAASLLPIGVAAYGNSFGSHAYQVSPHAKMPGIDASIDRLVREPARERRVLGVEMDPTEEAHRFLLHTLLEGFPLAWFERSFGASPRALVPEAFADLEELGALEVRGDAVVSHVADQAEKCLYGAMLYGPRVIEAIERRWGADYDPSYPYDEWVRDVSLGSA